MSVVWVATPATPLQSPARAHAVPTPQPWQFGAYRQALCGRLVIAEPAPETLPWCAECATKAKGRALWQR